MRWPPVVTACLFFFPIYILGAAVCLSIRPPILLVLYLGFALGGPARRTRPGSRRPTRAQMPARCWRAFRPFLTPWHLCAMVFSSSGLPRCASLSFDPMVWCSSRHLLSSPVLIVERFPVPPVPRASVFFFCFFFSRVSHPRRRNRLEVYPLCMYPRPFDMAMACGAHLTYARTVASCCGCEDCRERGVASARRAAFAVRATHCGARCAAPPPQTPLPRRPAGGAASTAPPRGLVADPQTRDACQGSQSVSVARGYLRRRRPPPPPPPPCRLACPVCSDNRRRHGHAAEPACL